MELFIIYSLRTMKLWVQNKIYYCETLKHPKKMDYARPTDFV